MEALKVTAEGLTTSFRYPHFVQGVQPTYEMPPPATVYGLVCGVLGEWFDPRGVRFALHFTFAGRVGRWSIPTFWSWPAGGSREAGGPRR